MKRWPESRKDSCVIATEEVGEQAAVELRSICGATIKHIAHAEDQIIVHLDNDKILIAQCYGVIDVRVEDAE